MSPRKAAKPKGPKPKVSPLLAALRAAHGEDSVVMMNDGGFAKVREVCPTGMVVVDRHVVGIGGLPWGRIVEIHGPEGGGKSTLLYKLLGAAQRDGGTAALADAEQKMDPVWAALHGVDVPSVFLLQPETTEDFVAQSCTILERAKPGDKPIIALDSIASIGTKAEMEFPDQPSKAMGAAARVWSHGLKKLNRLNAEKGGLIILVNQIRMKIGVMFGNPETTPGGSASRFYAIIRLKVSHGKSIKDGKVSTGRYVSVQAMKNQVAPPYRGCTLRLDYTTGFDDAWSITNYAKSVGCLEDKKDRRAVQEALANLGWNDVQIETPTEEEPSADESE